MVSKAMPWIVVLLALMVAGCGQQCTQDYSPPVYIDSTTSPYHLAWSTTNTDLGRVIWLNRTTSETGEAIIDGPVWELIWPFGYFQVMKVSMDIPLAPGANDILVTQYDRGWNCGFYDETVITYFP